MENNKNEMKIDKLMKILSEEYGIDKVIETSIGKEFINSEQKLKETLKAVFESIGTYQTIKKLLDISDNFNHNKKISNVLKSYKKSKKNNKKKRRNIYITDEPIIISSSEESNYDNDDNSFNIQENSIHQESFNKIGIRKKFKKIHKSKYSKFEAKKILESVYPKTKERNYIVPDNYGNNFRYYLFCNKSGNTIFLRCSDSLCNARIKFDVHSKNFTLYKEHSKPFNLHSYILKKNEKIENEKNEEIHINEENHINGFIPNDNEGETNENEYYNEFIKMPYSTWNN